MTQVVVLGGAAETRAVVEALKGAGFDPLVHWSRAPEDDLPACDSLRAGLQGAAALVDVTHAFDTDTRTLAHAMAPDLPFLRLTRPPWHPSFEDHWTQVPDLPRAVAAAPARARIFAATGRDSADVLAHHDGPVFLRQLQRHDRGAPPNCTFVFGDGPFSVEEEIALFEELRIDVLMARNVGGAASFPKVAAARALKLPVILLDPPPVPQGDVLTRLPDLVAQLRKAV